MVPRNERSNVADVFAELDTRDAKRVARILGEIREELRAHAGARVELVEFENGPPLEAPVAMRLLGDDAAALERAAAEVERVLGEVEGRATCPTRRASVGPTSGS